VLSHRVCKANVRTSDAKTRRRLGFFLAVYRDGGSDVTMTTSQVSSCGIIKR